MERSGTGVWVPGLWIDNVIVMAGVPSIMQAMLDEMSPKLKIGLRMLSSGGRSPEWRGASRPFGSDSTGVGRDDASIHARNTPNTDRRVQCAGAEVGGSYHISLWFEHGVCQPPLSSCQLVHLSRCQA